MESGNRSSRESAAPRPIGEREIEPAARVIARAFAWHEPWGEWTFPDETLREESLYRLALIDLEREFVPAGCAWTIDLSSVALWFPPHGHPAERFFAAGRRSPDQYEIYGDRSALVEQSDAMIELLRPAEPHWYLDTLATAPEQFGRGLGGRLLEHGCAHRDARGELAALDTHTERNLAFYARRGFTEIGRGQLPAAGPEVAMLLRRPLSSGERG